MKRNYKTIKRYGIVHTTKEGLTVLSFTNWACFHFDTEKQAKKYLSEMKKANSNETINTAKNQIVMMESERKDTRAVKRLLRNLEKELAYMTR